MKKLLYLVAVSMLAVLIVPPTAMAQSPAEEECPPETMVNAAGTTCTDLETGEIVVDTGITNPVSSPCPESSPGNVWTFENGRCLKNGQTPGDTQPNPQPQPMPQEMPKTGGPAVGSLLPVGALLIGSGILAFAVLRCR